MKSSTKFLDLRPAQPFFQQRVPFSSDGRVRLTLVLGGARSGKSRFAIELAKRCGRRITYIATCLARDQEMRERIARHREERPAHWRTIEHPPDLPATLAGLDHTASGIVIDDLTLYLSELLVQRQPVSTMLERVTQLCETARRIRPPVIVVSNDVGLGLVPSHRLGRQFRDLAGFANQIAAQVADEVYFLVAGIPLQLKASCRRHGGR